MPTPPPRQTLPGATNIELEDPFVPDPSEQCPAIAIRGASGTGKTHAIGQIMQRFPTIYIDIEDKFQSIARFGCPVLSINTPIRTAAGLRKPNIRERYERLWLLCERIEQGTDRLINFKGSQQPLRVIGGDGMMEVSTLIYEYHKADTPISKRTMERNTFEMWDNIGAKTLEFMQRMKSAASASASTFGLPPIAVVWTVGEAPDKKHGISWELLLEGRIAPRKFSFPWESVLRLSVGRSETGEVVHRCHTVGEEGIFDAKCQVPWLARPHIDNWNMADILEAHFEFYSSGEEKKGA